MGWISQHPRARIWATVLLLTLLAGVPRLVHPGLAEYKLDESTAVLAALNAIRQHVIPLHGQGSSVPGAAQGPLLYDLVAVVLLIRPDPRSVVATIGLLNALAVGLAYLVLRRSFGERIALIAATLFASGSWAIVFSRKIWPNDLLAPFAVIALWGLLRAIDSQVTVPGLGRTWVAVAGLVSLNFGAWPAVLGPALAQVLLPRTRRGAAFGWSMAGLVFFLATLVPRVPDVLAILAHLLAGSRTASALDFSPFSFVVQLAGPDAFQVLAGPTAGLARSSPSTAWLGVTLEGLLFFGAAVAVARVGLAWRRRGRCAIQPELIILFWWLTPALVAVPHLGIAVFIHHFLGTLPTQFVLIALSVDAMASGARKGLSRVTRSTTLRVGVPSLATGAFVLVVVALQLGVFVAYLPFVKAHPSTFFGPSLDLSLAVAQAARHATTNGPVFVLSDGTVVGVDVTPTVFASLAAGASFAYVDSDHTVPLPATGVATYFVAPASVQSLLTVLEPWQASGGPISALTRIGGSEGYARFQSRAPGSWLPPGWQHVEATTLDHAVITGYDAPRQIVPGTSVELEVAWRIGQSVSQPGQQSVFAHLIGSDGRSWASDDFAPLPSVSWQPGQLLINRFSLATPDNLPPGRYWIDFGRYERPGIRPVPLIGTNGRPGPTSLRLGPLAVPPKPRAHQALKPAHANFGHQIALAGWKVHEHATTVNVDLQWHAVQTPASSYTVFVHVLGPDGKIVAQSDSEPRRGKFPTSTWQAGNLAFDVHKIPLAQLPPGNYRVQVGLYLPRTGQRLPVGDQTSYTLGTIHVAG